MNQYCYFFQQLSFLFFFFFRSYRYTIFTLTVRPQNQFKVSGSGIMDRVLSRCFHSYSVSVGILYHEIHMFIFHLCQQSIYAMHLCLLLVRIDWRKVSANIRCTHLLWLFEILTITLDSPYAHRLYKNVHSEQGVVMWTGSGTTGKSHHFLGGFLGWNVSVRDCQTWYLKIPMSDYLRHHTTGLTMRAVT